VESQASYDSESKYHCLRGGFTLGVTRLEFERREDDRRKAVKDSESIESSEKPI
jgi:hypothetical protein